MHHPAMLMPLLASSRGVGRRAVAPTRTGSAGRASRTYTVAASVPPRGRREGPCGPGAGRTGARAEVPVSGGNSDPGRTVTSKVIAILEAVSAGGGRLTLSQISRRSRLPIATVHRLAGELVGWGGLERDAGGAYRIGARLWEIGSLTPNRTGLRELAMPFMEDIYEVTHENVQLT